jgi:hypothetical protein
MQSGLNRKTGLDFLNAKKYDSYELFVYEQLNKVIIKKYLEEKERKRHPKESRPKKSLLPFIDTN